MNAPAPLNRRPLSRMLAVAFAALICVPPSSPLCQAASALWSADSVRSQVLSRSVDVRVSLPAGYGSETAALERYPLVIVLDANNSDWLSSVAADARLLSAGFAVPPLIVVGVVHANRAREFALPPSRSSGSNPPTGGEQFAAFLATELLPWARAHFRTLPYIAVVGHSLTGAFALYAFQHFPADIDAVVALSPSLEAYDAALITERSRAGRLFVARGADEPRVSDSLFRVFIRRAEPAAKTIAFRHAELPQANHGLTRLQGTLDGLRFIFEPVALVHTGIYDAQRPPGLSPPNPGTSAFTQDSLKSARAFLSTKQAYARGAEALHMPKLLPPAFYEGLVGSAYYIPRLVAQDYVSAYPDLPSAHLALASVLARDHDVAAAKAQYELARSLADQMGWGETSSLVRRRLAALDSSPP